MGLAEMLEAGSSRDIIPGDGNAWAQRKTEEAELEKRIQEESGPCITRKPTPVECLELGIDLAKAQQMKPEDLTLEDIKKLLAAGVSKYKIRKLYGFRSPSSLYAKLKKWGLHERGERISKPESPDFDLDLSKFEKFGEPNPTAAVLCVSPKELRISGTDLQPGDRVVFYVNNMDLQGAGAGHVIIIKKSEIGRVLYSEKESKRSCRTSCRPLIQSLVRKGVPLPARYMLTWNEKMQAWVGSWHES